MSIVDKLEVGRPYYITTHNERFAGVVESVDDELVELDIVFNCSVDSNTSHNGGWIRTDAVESVAPIFVPLNWSNRSTVFSDPGPPGPEAWKPWNEPRSQTTT